MLSRYSYKFRCWKSQLFQINKLNYGIFNSIIGVSEDSQFFYAAVWKF